MTTHTRLIPPQLRTELDTARVDLQVAQHAGNQLRVTEILDRIDKLLDQVTEGETEWP